MRATMDDASGNRQLALANTDISSERESPDESLVAVACDGDEDAFKELFERHRRRIARIVGRFFNRPERVEEIVQEIFTKLYFALASFSPQRGRSFANWLSSIAINSCYDELRRIRRRRETAISEVNDEEIAWLKARLQGSEDTEGALIARDLAGKLLARLKPEDRLILTLLDVEEMPVSEIAQTTGWSVSKVKVRVYRARAALRKILSEYV
ncbi:MAG: sigma-70 family RNA polymerase sigma factor [Acidobacteriota bacterium]